MVDREKLTAKIAVIDRSLARIAEVRGERRRTLGTRIIERFELEPS